MSGTLADIEVEKAPDPASMLIPPTPKVARPSVRYIPAEQEQPRNNSKPFWIVAPISLLIAGSATFLVVRRWLRKGTQDCDKHLV